MHTSIHSGRTGNHPASPHAMVLTVSFVLSPGDRALLSPSLAKIASRKLDAGVEASGPHDFSVRKQNALVSSAACVHRIQPRVRDDRDTPLVWGGRRGYKSDLRFRKTRIFFQAGLDNPNHVDPAQEIRFCAQGHGARGSGPQPKCSQRVGATREAGYPIRCLRSRDRSRLHSHRNSN